ncbi:MAG: guanylate kinase [Anaerolineales bacterium]
MESTVEAIPSIEQYLNPPPVLLIITGPSGVGKDSVKLRMEELGARFFFVVTATDRCRRENEVHGRDYYFVTTDEFCEMIDRGELFEYARVYDQYKGVPKKHAREALLSGQDVVMRLDLTGADTVRSQVPGAVTVFVAPPSLAILEARLRQRKTDTEDEIKARLAAARRELARASEYDYVVINYQDDLDTAARQVMAIMEAERRRTKRQPIQF